MTFERTVKILFEWPKYFTASKIWKFNFFVDDNKGTKGSLPMN